MPALRSFDYIIVGGGTAACVLANRPTEDPEIRVLMLEAGTEPTSPWIKMPLAMGKLFTKQQFEQRLFVGQWLLFAALDQQEVELERFVAEPQRELAC